MSLEQSKTVQAVLDRIDACIRCGDFAALTLPALARACGYTPAHLSRSFRAVAGMTLRDYLRQRRLAFATRSLCSGQDSILDIALAYGYASHAAFTHAFRAAYGLTPRQYRRAPVPLALRTLLRPFDCYLAAQARTAAGSARPVQSYLVHIPAHSFLHIRNYESIGYWDFWQKQSHIPGQDCETICALLSSIPHKLDDLGGDGIDSGAGQIMGFLNHPRGRICSWGIPLAECYGVRLPYDYDGPVPAQMQLMQVPAGDYVVFEHGPFDFQRENAAVEGAMEQAMAAYDYAAAGCALDTAPGRLAYFFHDQTRFWKYIRPVKRL